MACTSPIEIKNPRKIKHPLDPSIILVPCGKCYECRKRYGNDWRIRLLDEIRYSTSTRNYFVTLTLSDDYYPEFSEDPSLAIRRFNERYRRKYKHSCRHWFVTELGDTTQRLHFHGILFNCDIPFDKYTSALNTGNRRQNLDYRNEYLRKLWKYGNVFVGFCNELTASYIVKYVTKPQYLDNGDFYQPRVYTSPGMGKAYTEDPVNRLYHKNLGSTYILKRGGFTYALPRYYKTKLYTEFEIRFAQLQYYKQIDKPKFLKGKFYPDTEEGYRDYITALCQLHNFNSTFYGNKSATTQLSKLQRQTAIDDREFAQWKRSLSEDPTVHNF